MTSPTNPPPPTFGGTSCLGLIGGFILLVILGSCTMMVFGGGGGSGGSNYTAEHACTEAVKARLKAPSTASVRATQYIDNGDTIRFFGEVDAENSFGARLTSGWSCTVTETGSVLRVSVAG